MDCITTEEQMLDIIKNKFTNELYLWMKRQFSDVCSYGDVSINNILDDLNSVYNIKNKKELSVELKYIDYIYDAYINMYLLNKDPDPFWAD